MPLSLGGNGVISGIDWAGTGGGLAHITTSSFTTASTVSVDGCFTSAYEDYRVDYTITASSTSNAEMALRLRVAGVDSSASYLSGRLYQVTTTVSGSAFATNRFFTGYSPNSSGPPHFAVIDITRVAVAAQTSLVGRSTYSDGNVYNEILSGVHTASTAYDGFTIYPASGTITGTVRVYGYIND